MPHSSLSKISYSWKARLLRQIGWIAPSSLSFLLRVMALSPAVMLTQPLPGENTRTGTRVSLASRFSGRVADAPPTQYIRLEKKTGRAPPGGGRANCARHSGGGLSHEDAWGPVGCGGDDLPLHRRRCRGEGQGGQAHRQDHLREVRL